MAVRVEARQPGRPLWGSPRYGKVIEIDRRRILGVVEDQGGRRYTFSTRNLEQGQVDAGDQVAFQIDEGEAFGEGGMPEILKMRLYDPPVPVAQEGDPEGLPLWLRLAWEFACGLASGAFVIWLVLWSARH
ncbi:MAG: hypothetical protein HUK26_08745 [Duodenibacillus sp.]|nr:hypothetical protein [Duodenibacillus sp.]